VQVQRQVDQTVLSSVKVGEESNSLGLIPAIALVLVVMVMVGIVFAQVKVVVGGDIGRELGIDPRGVERQQQGV